MSKEIEAMAIMVTVEGMKADNAQSMFDSRGNIYSGKDFDHYAEELRNLAARQEDDN